MTVTPLLGLVWGTVTTPVGTCTTAVGTDTTAVGTGKTAVGTDTTAVRTDTTAVGTVPQRCQAPLHGHPQAVRPASSCSCPAL